MKARIIPGAVDTGSLRGIVLTDSALAGLQIDPPAQVHFQQVAGSPSFAAQMTAGGVRLYHFQVSGLAPGTEYVLEADGAEPVLFRTLEANPDAISFLAATCYYDGFHQDRHYLAGLKARPFGLPAFKILAGDNVYVDVAPAQNTPWGGYEETVFHYLRYLWNSDYGSALATLPTYTTWDDHEFWNNYPEDQCHLSRTSKKWRQGYVEAGQECLSLFQQALNPPAVAGRSYCFQAGALEFFVLDIRSGRTRRRGDKYAMFSDAELRAFRGWCQGLKGPGVVVLGQPIWIETGNSTDYTPPNFEEEYRAIWETLAAAKREIVVLSGDVHHSRVLEIQYSGGSLVEVITSPACHIPTIDTMPVGGSEQDRGKVSMPDDVLIQGSALKPKAQYRFGTDAKNTVAALAFSGLRGDKVRLQVAFLDLADANARPAKAVPGLLGKTRWPSQSELCVGEFDLARKG